jgi:outer membrane protein assembly factor BamB
MFNRRAVPAVALLLFTTACASQAQKPKPVPPACVDVLTQRYNVDRTGHNPLETVLTPGNVNTKTFGKLFDLEVDGQIYSQPLIVSGIDAGGKRRNTVLVATMSNTLYLFDADTGERIWSRNYGFPVLTPNAVWNGGGYYQDITPAVGILSTPVVDRETETIYFTSFQWDPRTSITTATHWLHAVDLIDLSNKFGGPVSIQGEVTASPGPVHAGHADMAPPPGTLEFDGSQQLQRPSLLLDRGRIVLGFGSHGDQSPYQGWIFTYAARDLQQPPLIWNSIAGGASETWDQAGIWQSGVGITSDGEGGYLLATGNGDFHPAYHHFADSVVRLVPKDGALTVADYFTPCDQQSLSSQDLDLGSGGVLRIPGTDLLVAGGKGGTVYVLDKNNLGKYHAPDDFFTSSCVNPNIPQEFLNNCANPPENSVQPTSTPCTSQIANYSLHHIHGTPVVWRSALHGLVLYVWRENDVVRGFAFDEQTKKFIIPPCTPAGSDWNAGPQPSPATVHLGMTGGMLTISSNQGKDGILWAVTPINNDANQKVVPGILRAYDADDLRKELWNSFQVRGRDDFGNYAKFTPPVVANGKVYLPTFSNHLSVYGLNPPPAANPVNLVRNGSFEEGAVGWTASGASPLFQVNGRYPYLNESQGTLCPTSQYDVTLSQDVVLPQAGRYRLTAYAGTNILPGNVVPSGQLGAVLVGVEVDGASPVVLRAPVMPGSGYQRHTLTFEAPAGATARVWFYAPKTQDIPNFGNQPDLFVMLDSIELVAD